MTPAVSRRTFLSASGAAAGALAADSPKKVRIGIVGGRFGATFQWHRHPSCSVEAVCDIRADRVQAMREIYRCESGYSEFREMLRHPGLDAVGVFTPAPLHAWMAIEAMNAGKHVVSAVPAALKLDDLESLVETVRRTGMRYMMAETTYYRPQIITCRKWAEEGRFGDIFYSESEYHHNFPQLMYDERGLPTWRHGLPPMWYITHQTGAIVPVTRERLTQVQAIGWGDGHQVLQTNRYNNPFWNTNAFFKTSGGHSSRISVFWHAPAGFAQRSQFYGEKLSYIMGRQSERHADTVMSFDREGPTALDGPGNPEAKVVVQPADDDQQKYWHLLPEPMRAESGHAGSHAQITHEFVDAITNERHPDVDVWESAAYTAPGLVAHASALNDGELMKMPDFGVRPG